MTQHQKILGNMIAVSETDFAELERKAAAADWVQNNKAHVNPGSPKEWYVVAHGTIQGRGPTWLEAVEQAMKETP